MILFVLKYLICSLCLYLPYELWFKDIKFHSWKRFYLILVLILPIVIPFISLPTYSEQQVKPLEFLQNESLVTLENIAETSTRITQEANTSTIDYQLVIWYLFLTGLVIFALRFLKNLWKMNLLIRKNQVVQVGKVRVVLLDSAISPFSFFNYVFVHKEEYNNGLDPLIWKHEMAHIKQLHSIDVLVLELQFIFAYWNPVLYFAKKSIKYNHECLADDFVIRRPENIQTYQYLLIGLNSDKQVMALGSHLDFNQLKTRIIMMNKTENWKRKAFLASFSIMLIAGSTLLFSNKNADENESIAESMLSKANTALNLQAPQDTIEGIGASKEQLAEYDKALNKIKEYKKNHPNERFVDISSLDQRRMGYIAYVMNKEQREARTNKDNMFLNPSTFIIRNTRPKKKSPNKTTFENWKNPNVYGVWIDGKKSNNKALSNLENSDIVYYTISKLYGKAKEGRKYTHQLDIYTAKGFQEAYKNYLFDAK
ncbi:M56 family metallopeptidase [Sphingobacterium lactis]|uniref:M56 family metallopeptidase n=1 Tax=Sphingobacterium lactis TaxID=797291 RepID=UPI003F8133C0